MPHGPSEQNDAQLQRGSVLGLYASVGGQALRLLIAAGQVIVLSRLLPPSVWGIFGMTWAVVAQIYNSRDLGLASAVVQKDELTPGYTNAAFWLSLGSGASLAAFVALLGYPLSWFYHEPVVLEVSLKFAPMFLLSGLNAFYQALLRRRMQYLRLNIVLTIAQFVGTGGAILMAYSGFGINSLIFMLMGQELTCILILPFISNWHPSRPGLHGEGRGLLSFGGDLSVFRMAQNLAYGMDQISLSYFYQPAMVGLYNRAQTLFATPRRQLLIPFSQLAPTLLSRLQRNPEAFATVTTRLLNGISYLWFPFLALLIAAPQPLLETVLGPQWTDAAVLLPVMAIGEISRLHLNLLTLAETQLARTRSLRNFGIASSPILAAAFFFGASGSPMKMVIAFAVVQNLLYIVRLIQVSKDTPLKFPRMMASLLNPALLAVVLCGAFAIGARVFPDAAPWLRLISALVAGGIAFLIFVGVFPKGRRELLSVVSTLRVSRS